ncbi:hypothetical protein DPSP01_010465 [Paraphaeosphaeria sporulosa]|uniref:Uncharacterized protein n=1 Tax=Paraphaeosphaeria sporulosa TaxID=1460663 RepID=A0A177BWU6_9PLEO|nr:uncharacterized protein CC84DRAFT_325722 [Paraphaeosphaeria sporulosa]OAF99872.1 hypothetical protein CC84DRAFT_325722 [Paraphaeosphaeria sporulosa]
MGVGETITVINRSGKVVSSSKHIINVFKEAKSAYRERKAEIQAERSAALHERKLRDAIKSVRLDDDTRSRASSHRSKHSHATHRSKSHRPSRPPLERGFTDSFYANDDSSPRRSRHRFEDDLAGAAQEGHRMELARRNTEAAVAVKREDPARRKSDSGIDMDLCYGEIPPPLPDKRYDEVELRDKASKITMLLDEANCLQYSVTSMIENLQKNPDALAAVALTLGEISTMVKKMGPSVLPILAKSFPAVVALLASPQFMIAGGVAVGVTIVALGGYKIVKKLQAQKEEQGHPMAMTADVGARDEPLMLDELEPPELGRIEVWRRGIADVEAESAGTSVDGEFITPGATRHLAAEGVLDEDDIRSRRSARSRKDGEHRSKSHKAKSVRSEATTKTTKTTKTAKTEKTERSSTTSRSKTVKEKSKKKEPSGLKMLFRSHSS